MHTHETRLSTHKIIPWAMTGAISLFNQLFFDHPAVAPLLAFTTSLQQACVMVMSAVTRGSVTTSFWVATTECLGVAVIGGLLIVLTRYPKLQRWAVIPLFLLALLGASLWQISFWQITFLCLFWLVLNFSVVTRLLMNLLMGYFLMTFPSHTLLQNYHAVGFAHAAAVARHWGWAWLGWPIALVWSGLGVLLIWTVNQQLSQSTELDRLTGVVRKLGI